MIKNKIWDFNNYEKKFENGTFTFIEEGEWKNKKYKNSFKCEIKIKSKCFLTIKGIKVHEPETKCKIMKDKKNGLLYIKPKKCFGYVMDNKFKLYAKNLKNSNISKNEIVFKYNQKAYNEEGEFLEWF